MSGVPGAAYLDEGRDSDKLHSDVEAIVEATPVTELIPRPRASPLAINAAAIGVEWIRYAYYEDYPDKLLNVPYLITFATACLAVSLVAERLVRVSFINRHDRCAEWPRLKR
jgi:hypothetical protein